MSALPVLAAIAVALGALVAALVAILVSTRPQPYVPPPLPAQPTTATQPARARWEYTETLASPDGWHGTRTERLQVEGEPAALLAQRALPPSG